MNNEQGKAKWEISAEETLKGAESKMFFDSTEDAVENAPSTWDFIKGTWSVRAEYIAQEWGLPHSKICLMILDGTAQGVWVDYWDDYRTNYYQWFQLLGPDKDGWDGQGFKPVRK